MTAVWASYHEALCRALTTKGPICCQGFQIVSEKFYTVDDFNPHITKCNKMIIVWHLAGSSHGKSRRYMWR
jgi:hypothetical protein